MIHCVTVHCVSPDEMWVVLIALPSDASPVARVRVSATFHAAESSDGDGRLRTSERPPALCTLTEVQTLLDALERGRMAQVAEILAGDAGPREAPERFRCGVHTRVTPEMCAAPAGHRA